MHDSFNKSLGFGGQGPDRIAGVLASLSEGLCKAEGLAKQVEQLKIESLRDVSVLQMIDPPVVPRKRHSPARMATVELLTALSFVFACSLAFLMDFFRRSPVDRDMLRELLKAWK